MPQIFLIERADNGCKELFGNDGFDEETHKPNTQSIERQFPGAVPGNDHAGKIGAELATMLKGFDAGAIRQIHIGKKKIKRCLAHHLKRLGATSDGLRGITRLGQHVAHFL